LEDEVGDRARTETEHHDERDQDGDESAAHGVASLRLVRCPARPMVMLSPTNRKRMLTSSRTPSGACDVIRTTSGRRLPPYGDEAYGGEAYGGEAYGGEAYGGK
ncbi:hypothetical protein, partial [Streptomyces venezuelae]|uniref:hypothetical protein n=1 Tax=Streptomyces venezuelae TaxID=54571 RepID=UPI001F1F4295